MAKIETQKQYRAIDGLRAFSAVGIILMHVLANGSYGLKGFVFEELIPSFTNLVFLFMIISGFSVCCGYYDKIVNQKITLETFYSKRYAKIWPYFALLCLLDVLISPSKEALYELFANLTLCFGLLPNPNMSVIGVGWFLGVAFVFYLIFPFVCYLISNKRRLWLAYVAVLCYNILGDVYFGTNRSHFIYSAVFFFTGCVIYAYRKTLLSVTRKYRWAVLSVTVIAILGYYAKGASTPIMLIMFSLFLIYALGDGRKLLQNRVTAFISGISMEMYLSHMMIFRVLEKLGIDRMSQSDTLRYCIMSVGTLAGTILFSVLANKGLEMIKELVREIQNNYNSRKQ